MVVGSLVRAVVTLLSSSSTTSNENVLGQLGWGMVIRLISVISTAIILVERSWLSCGESKSMMVFGYFGVRMCMVIIP